MVVSCVARTYVQSQKIRRLLVAITGTLSSQVFEEKIAENEFVISVRIDSTLEIKRAKDALKDAGAADISEFAEVA